MNYQGDRQTLLPAACAISSSGSISCRSANCGTVSSARGGDRVCRFPFPFTFLRLICTEIITFCFKLSCLLNVFNFYVNIYKKPFPLHDMKYNVLIELRNTKKYTSCYVHDLDVNALPNYDAHDNAHGGNDCDRPSNASCHDQSLAVWSWA